MNSRTNEGQIFLNSLVHHCLLRFNGGEGFFHNLDHRLKDRRITDLLIKKVVGHQDILVSGQFGRFFYPIYKSLFRSIVVVDGGLRDIGKTVSLNKHCELIKGRSFTLVDDSFYSGITRDKIRFEIQRLGGRLEKSFVIYDGALLKDDAVASLFRYYG